MTLSIKTGRQPIADLAHRMGITNDFPVTRSLALGVAAVSVIDMTSSYSVFASGGYKTPAYGITRITTLRGDLVYEDDANAPRERVLSEKTVGYMDTHDARRGHRRHRPRALRSRRPRGRQDRHHHRTIAMRGSAASPAIMSPPSGSAMTTTTRPTG